MKKKILVSDIVLAVLFFAFILIGSAIGNRMDAASSEGLLFVRENAGLMLAMTGILITGLIVAVRSAIN